MPYGSWINDLPTGFFLTVHIALIAAYVAVVATGLPLVHPGRETVDGLALCTKTVEAVGLLTAANLLRRPSLPVRSPKGTLT